MSWVTFMWPVMTGACATMAYLQLVIWLRQRETASLLFALLAASIAVISVGELIMMQSTDARFYGDVLRWVHVPGAAMFMFLAMFVRVQYPAARAALCWSVVATRLGAVAANFLTGENVNYLRIDSLRQVDMGGGAIGAVAVGPVNPWMLLGQLSNLLLLVYLVDTILRAYRARDRQQFFNALRFCGSATIFTLLTNTWHAGVVVGWIDAPDLLVPTFVCVLGIMSYEVSGQVMRAGQLSLALEATEGQLRENQLRLDIAMDAAEIGPWSWDPTRDRFLLSAMAARLHALDVGGTEEVDGERMRSRLFAEDRPALQAAYDQAQREGGEFRAEYRVHDGRGAIRWVSARGRLRAGARGELGAVYGVVADITERRQHEERFRLAVEASPTVMLVVNASGGIALANRRAESVLGYSADELVGCSIEMLVPERFQPDHSLDRKRFAENPTARPMGAGRDLYARHKDGTEVPVEIALNPIRMGDSVFVLASISDVSERRRLEREAAVHRDELAHLSRVALLAELSGSLAHELNQPLTAILSNAQAATRFLAMAPPDLKEVRVSLANIVDSDRRAGEVIRRLRAMMRREAPEHRPVDANEVVADVLRIIRSDLLNRGTETVLELQPELPSVQGDRVQLQQVLLNLLMNGCDSMAGVPERSRELRIRTTAVADGGIEISVRDRGRGIPDADLERIFSPFFTTKREGMGLGLAVCRSIVDSHRGRLWAENNPQEGATARLWLPRDGAEPPAPRPRDARKVAPGA